MNGQALCGAFISRLTRTSLPLCDLRLRTDSQQIQSAPPIAVSPDAAAGGYTGAAVLAIIREEAPA